MIFLLVVLYLIGGFLYAMIAVAAVALLIVAVGVYGSVFLGRMAVAKTLSHTPPTWNFKKPETPKFKIWVERFAKHAPVILPWILGLSLPVYVVIYMNTH